MELHGNPRNRIKQIKQDLKGTNIKVSALCWGACGGKLVSNDAGKRKDGISQLKSALESAGELGSTGVILVPAFNNDTNLPNKEVRKILLDVLPVEGGTVSQPDGARGLREIGGEPGTRRGAVGDAR